MFDEILKFGSMIVDALRVYRHPVFVYIPPYGELRGGSWVVVDPTINLAQMEIYADEQSRGSVLEPPGICEIKLKENERKKLMLKNDHLIQQWYKDLAAAPVSILLLLLLLLLLLVVVVVLLLLLLLLVLRLLLLLHSNSTAAFAAADDAAAAAARR